MKKRRDSKLWIILTIIAIVVILIFTYIFIGGAKGCADKANFMTYFEKSYYLSQVEFNNQAWESIGEIPSGWAIQIPEEKIIAKYSETNNCYNKGSYFIKEDGKLNKVNKEKFDNFIESYDSSSFLVEISISEPPGIFLYDISSEKKVCNTYDSHYYNISDCVNVTS